MLHVVFKMLANMERKVICSVSIDASLLLALKHDKLQRQIDGQIVVISRFFSFTFSRFL